MMIVLCKQKRSLINYDNRYCKHAMFFFILNLDKKHPGFSIAKK